jgi:hypothetical protein
MPIGSSARIIERAAIATAAANDDDAMTVGETNREEKQAAPICLAHPDETKTKREEIADE